MAVTLLFSRKATAKIDSIELDAAVSEAHKTEIEVTDHPVEQGANIVDHRRRKPDAITIEGLVSNTPLAGPNAPLQTQTYNGREFQARSEQKPGRMETARDELLRLADSGTLITIITAIRTYENMTMTDLNIPRDAKVGEALRFTATFKAIRIVQSKAVKVQTRTSRGKPKEDLNKKAAPTAPEAPKKKSLAKLGKDFANDLQDPIKRAQLMKNPFLKMLFGVDGD